jgi:hypothetical protein
MKEHLKEGSKNAIIIGNNKLKEGLLRNDLLISDILLPCPINGVK